MNESLKAFEAKEVKLEAKIDILSDALNNVINQKKNDDHLDCSKCKECDKNLNCGQILNQHMGTTHPKSGQIHQKPENNAEDQQLKCDECEYFCGQKFEMKEHKNDKLKICLVKKRDLCNNTFPENCDLERNIRNHHEVETFECEKCDKNFVHEWRLKKHQSLHIIKKFWHYFNNGKACPFEGCLQVLLFGGVKPIPIPIMIKIPIYR